MRVELVDMDLFTATRIAVSNQQSSSEFSYKSQVCQNVLIEIQKCLNSSMWLAFDGTNSVRFVGISTLEGFKIIAMSE